MRFKSALAVVASVSTTGVLAQKTGVADWAASFDDLLPELETRKLPSWTTKSWNVNANTNQFPGGGYWRKLFQYPQAADDVCKGGSAGKGFQVYNVTYSDCPNDPWIVGYCEINNTNGSDKHLSLNEVIQILAKIPAPLRSLFASAVYGSNGYSDSVSKQDPGTSNAVFFSGTSLFRGKGWSGIALLRFATKFLSPTNDYWNSAAFVSALDRDTCVLQKDIISSREETFYSAAALAAYEVWTGKKFTALNVECMRNQLEQIKRDFNFSSKYSFNGQCSNKNTVPVERTWLRWEADDMDTVVNNALGPAKTPVSRTKWDPLMVPKPCYDFGKGWSKNDGSPLCAPAQWTVWNITYSDCAIPWTICTCSDAAHMLDNYVNELSRVPVAMRSFNSVMMLFNNPGGGGALYAAQDIGGILVLNWAAKAHVLLHELGHILDWFAGKLSETAAWRDAKNADTVLFQGATTDIELFADVTMALTLRKHGWEHPAMSRMSNQFAIVDKYVGRYIGKQAAGEKCNATTRAAYPVPPTVRFTADGTLITSKRQTKLVKPAVVDFRNLTVDAFTVGVY